MPKFCRPNFANRERGSDGDEDDDDEDGDDGGGGGNARRLRNGPANHAPMPADRRRLVSEREYLIVGLDALLVERA